MNISTKVPANWFPLSERATAAGILTMAQYGSEAAYPVSEGTSLGLILLMGQISGALLVFAFEALTKLANSIVLPMLIIVLATAIQVPIILRMKESKFVGAEEYNIKC